FLGREYQAMQGRGSAHSSAMGATEDAAARRVIAGQGPGERCWLHHKLRGLVADARGSICLVLVERLVLEQGLRQRVELRPVLAQERDDLFVRLFHDAPNFAVDEL